MAYLVIGLHDFGTGNGFPAASAGESPPVLVTVHQRVETVDRPDPDRPGFIVKHEAPPRPELGTLVFHDDDGHVYTLEHGPEDGTYTLRRAPVQVPDDWLTYERKAPRHAEPTQEAEHRVLTLEDARSLMQHEDRLRRAGRAERP